MIAYYFSTQACGPCRAFYPVCKKYLEERGASVTKIDLTDVKNENFKERFNVRTVPTVVVLKEDVEVVRSVGAQFADLKRILG